MAHHNARHTGGRPRHNEGMTHHEKGPHRSKEHQDRPGSIDSTHMTWPQPHQEEKMLPNASEMGAVRRSAAGNPNADRK